MAKGNKKFSVVNYPEEKEGRTKDANRKLRGQLKRLNKIIKRQESEIRTLQRAFDKSCDFIQDKLKNKSLNEILKMIHDFDYKETEQGRVREKKKTFTLPKCPKCDRTNKEGFALLEFANFNIESCACGYRKKVQGEGNERS